MEVIRKELETGTIMFVPVKDNWSCFKIKNKSLYFRCKTTEGKFAIGSTQIPYLDWQLLGISDQLTEEDLAVVMPNMIEILDWLPNKDAPEVREVTALEAFNSLKESLGIVDVNKYNNKPVKIVTGNLGIDDAEWQQEQSKVRKHIVLFEAKK